MNESPANQSETFRVSPEGNFIGQDGFVVPKNFAEFYARNPNYVRRWTEKRLRQRTPCRRILPEVLILLQISSSSDSIA